MFRISVVIPVYNSGKYLRKCVKSLFLQTLTDIEYIFVDDASVDDSLSVLGTLVEEFKGRLDRENKRVCIVRNETNTGAAMARQKGLDNATGEYVINCDSDDSIDIDLYEKMYGLAVAEDADVVVCDLCREGSNEIINPYGPISSSGKEILVNQWRKPLHMSLCNKMVRRSIFTDNSICFKPGLNMWEDNLIMYRVLYYSSLVRKIDGPRYYYNKSNSGSVTSGYGESAVRQMIDCAGILSDFFQGKPDGAEFSNSILSLKYLAKLNLVTDSFRLYREFYQVFPESTSFGRRISGASFSGKGKIRYFFVVNHLGGLFVLLFKCRNILCGNRNGRKKS